jgi:hypothetical protein
MVPSARPLFRLFAVLAVALVGCGGSRPEASAPPAPSVSVPGPGDWEKWSFDQRLAYMKSPAFLDRERELFRSYDAARFAEIDCRTCHGAGAAAGTFHMPNPDLPKWPGGKEAFVELKAKNPRTLQFMQKELVPETARLLGVPPFDFSTHTGFSCFQCHTRPVEPQ